MQQTDKYKLNLVESSDAFSPEPLNENTQILEAKLAALESGGGELDDRVTVLEGHKLVLGTYTGNGADARSFTLGFAPRVVLVQGADSYPLMAFQSQPYWANTIVVNSNGFSITSRCNINVNGRSYHYLAFK